MSTENAKCSKYKACPFFNGLLKNQPDRIDYVKSSYCFDDYEHCARYVVSEKLGTEKVPENLLPQDVFDATKIISQYE